MTQPRARSLRHSPSPSSAKPGHPASAQPFKTQAREVPKFEADASWAKLPNKWVWGQVSSVSIDEEGNAWILQRPSTVRADQKGMAAPPVLVFDEAGNFLRGWGGPGAGYDWPETEHGIYVDPKGFVWLGGNGKTDHHLVKFTKDGKFVMQIGRKGQSKGNKDTENVNMAADAFVHSPTNELFVADGYGNRRIVVFDADTGKFKRMWGAFGNEPLDKVPPPAEGPGGPAHSRERSHRAWARPVHHARACGAGIAGRTRLCLRPRRQARAGVHARRQIRDTGVHRPLLRGAALRQRADRRLAPHSRTIRSSGSCTSPRGVPRGCGCSTGRRSSRWIRLAGRAWRRANSTSCTT